MADPTRPHEGQDVGADLKGKHWTPDEDEQLLAMVDGSRGCLRRAAAHFGRTVQGVKGRVEKLRRTERRENVACERISRPAPGVLVHRLLW